MIIREKTHYVTAKCNDSIDMVQLSKLGKGSENTQKSILLVYRLPYGTRVKGHYFKPNAGWEGDENRLLANFSTAYRRKPLFNNFPSQKREGIRVLYKDINIKITTEKKKLLVCLGWAVAQAYHQMLRWKSTPWVTKRSKSFPRGSP